MIVENYQQVLPKPLTMFSKSKRKRDHQVEAGAMADIAFLLLIFFLVTTTILEENGLQVRLPAYLPAPVQPLNDRNVLSVKINASNQLLVEQEQLEIEDLADLVKTFIVNPDRLPHFSTSPQRSVVALQHDRATAYTTYIAVYNELLFAYQEIWEAEAQKTYGRSYEELGTRIQRIIRKAFPLVISESEPVEF